LICLAHEKPIPPLYPIPLQSGGLGWQMQHPAGE